MSTVYILDKYTKKTTLYFGGAHHQPLTIGPEFVAIS